MMIGRLGRVGDELGRREAGGKASGDGKELRIKVLTALDRDQGGLNGLSRDKDTRLDFIISILSVVGLTDRQR